MGKESDWFRHQHRSIFSQSQMSQVADHIRVAGAALCGAALFLCLLELPKTMALHQQLKNYLSVTRILSNVFCMVGCIGMIFKADIFLVIPEQAVTMTPIAIFFGGAITTLARAFSVPTVVRRSFVGLHFKLQLNRKFQMVIEVILILTCAIAFSFAITAMALSIQAGETIVTSVFYTPYFRIVIGLVAVFQAIISSVGDYNLLTNMKEIRNMLGQTLSSSILIVIWLNLVISAVLLGVGLASVIAPQFYFPLDVFVAPVNVALTIMIANEFHSLIHGSNPTSAAGAPLSRIISSIAKPSVPQSQVL
jgi:hypothetical protein